MSRAVQFISVILLCISIGLHWTALQLVAWGNMFVEFSRETAVSTALIKTFNGENPCSICLSIRQGRQLDKDQKSDVSHTKIELKVGLNSREPALLNAPVVQPLPSLDGYILTTLRESPPVPPPIYS